MKCDEFCAMVTSATNPNSIAGLAGRTNIRSCITMKNLLYVLDDVEVDGMLKVFKKFKNRAGSKERIHLNTDEDFSKHIANFAATINKRLNLPVDPSEIEQISIALIDNCEECSRAVDAGGVMLVTRIGLMKVNKFFPQLNDGAIIGLLTHWRAFYKYSRECYIDKDKNDDDESYSMVEPCVEALLEASNGADADVKARLLSERDEDGCFAYGQTWDVDLVNVKVGDVKEAVKGMKAVLKESGLPIGKCCTEKDGHDYTENEAHADEVECPKCGGTGKSECDKCSGEGRDDICPKCEGVGKVKCASCGGAGMNMDYDPPVKCSACEGSGWVECADCDGTGESICEVCHGEGEMPCENCHETGFVPYHEALNDVEVFDRVSGEVDYRELLLKYGKAGKVLVRAAKNGDVDAAYVLSTALDEVDDAEHANILAIARKSKFGLFREAMSFLGIGEHEKALASFEKIAKEGFEPAYGYIALSHHLGVLGLDRDQKLVAKYCRRYCDSTRKQFAPSVCGRNLIEFMINFPRAITGDGEAIIGLGRILHQWKIEDVALSEKVRLAFCDCSAEWYLKAWKTATKHKRAAVVEESLSALHEMADRGSRVAKNCIAEIEGMSTGKRDAPQESHSTSQQVDRSSNAKPKDVSESQSDRVVTKGTQKKTTPPNSSKDEKRSNKRRWKFVLLGLFFGWFGAHYMYAKRWLMLLLTIGGFATGVVMMDKSESNRKEEPAQTETKGDTSKGNGDAIGALCLMLWLVMWLGGALFVKKDGKGNRM